VSIRLSTHWKVLNLNRAIQKQVGSVNNISLNEFTQFHYLETCHIQGHGIGKSSPSTKEKLSPKDSTTVYFWQHLKKDWPMPSMEWREM
jgi:hypothetical protein